MKFFFGSTLLAIAALFATSSAALAQSTGPHKLPPGNLLPGPATGDQGFPFVEPGATHFLVVWVDRRLATTPFSGDQTGSDIYAARIDAAGVLVDLDPILISMEYGEQTAPRATWNGTHWLVTWSNQTATSTFYETQIWGVRVAADGTVVDPAPIVIYTGANALASFDITANGSDWLVVTQSTSGSGLLAVRIAGNGTVLDSPPTVLVPPTFFLYSDVHLASAGGNFLVIYDGTQSSNDALQAQIYTGALAPVGSLFTVGLTAQVEGAGSLYLVVEKSGNQLIGQRLNASGAPIDANPFAVTQPNMAITNTPAVTFDGTDFWVTFRSLANVRAARVIQSGVSVDLSAPVIAPHPSSGQYATGGALGGGLVLATSEGVGLKDLLVRYIASDFSASAPFVVSLSAPSQEFADMVAIPGGAVVVWTSYSGAGQTVWLQILDTYGAALLNAPLAIGTGDGASVAQDGISIAVVYHGSEFGAPNEVLVRRVGFDGVPLDSGPTKVMEGFSADVEGLAGRFLIAATNYVGSIGSHIVDVRIRRMDTNGVFLDPVETQVGFSYARYPRIIAVGNHWLLTYQRNYTHDNPGSDLRAMFVELDGTVGAESMYGIGGTPAVATSGSTVLFVWRSGTSASSAPDIMGRRMLTDGTFLDGLGGFAIGAAPNVQRSPVVAWNGEAYQVAWEDLRNSVVFFDKRSDVFGNRVTEAGQVLDGNGMALVDTETAAKDVVLVEGLNGGAVAVFSQFSTAPGEFAYRIHAALVGAWADQGFGLNGTAPLDLDLRGAVVNGGAVTAHLNGAQSFTPGAFVFGVGTSMLPTLGGVLVPKQHLVMYFGTDSLGTKSVTIPVGVSFVGLPIYAQAWTVDAGGPLGFAASNAVSTLGL